MHWLIENPNWYFTQVQTFISHTRNFYCLFTVPGFAGNLSQSDSVAQPKAKMVAPFVQFLFLLLPTLGQELSSTDVTCDPGFLCIRERHCPRFLELKDQLSHLLNDASEAEHRDKLIGKLTKRVCNKSEREVCCRENLEVINGNTVNSIEDIPFIVRLKIKTSSCPYSYSICGASLVHSQFLLTAKHCLTTFYDQCLDESDCVAHFRDLVRRGHENFHDDMNMSAIIT